MVQATQTGITMSEPTLAATAAADTGSVTESQTTETEASTDSGSDTSNGFNPAWNGLLEKLPKEFHNIVAPDLKQWDDNFSKKTQEVQSRYSPYEQFVKDEVSPETIQAGLQLAAIIEADPKAFYEKMGEYYKEQWGQGQSEAEVPDGQEEMFSLDGTDDIANHPKFKELAEQNKVVTEYLAQQIREQQAREADEEIQRDVDRLKEEHGDWDEEFVYSYAMQNDVTLEDAVKKFVSLRDGYRAKPLANDSAPPVYGGAGGLPSTQPNPGKLDSRATKNLVAEMLAKAQAQG